MLPYFTLFLYNNNMGQQKIIIISVFTTISFLLLVALLIVLFKINKTSKNNQILSNVLSFAQKERLTKVEIILQRLSIIAKSNKKFSDVFDDLSNDFDDISVAFYDLSNSVESMALEVKTLPFKKFRNEIGRIEKMNEKLEEQIIQFKSKANGLLKKEEFLRNEMSFCREKLRVITNLYSYKSIILDKIENKINVLNYTIIDLTKQFDSAIEKGDNDLASKIMNDIREKIIVFAIVINEGPKIQATIYGTIPELIKKLIKLHEHAEKDLKVDLSNMDFNSDIVSLSNLFNKIKASFLEIDLETCKQNMILLIKNIKALERNIKFEIKARNIFIDNYQCTLDILDTTLKQYAELQEEVKKLPSSGKVISVEIADSMEELREELESFKEFTTSFYNLLKNMSIPYTSKLSRMKIILNKSITQTLVMNDIYKRLWEDDSIKLTVQNQFLQIEQALISLRSQVIEKSIVLSHTEEQQLASIYESKREIKELLSTIPFNAKLATSKSQMLVDNVSTYYKVVGGKLEMSNIISNLIKEFSSTRALNNKLNISFAQSEKDYLSGDYAASLNMLIEGIQELNKTKKKR